MAIANITPEAKKLLDTLSTEEREVIWSLVSPAASKKARIAYRKALTEYLVELFVDECDYKKRAAIYASLITMADGEPVSYENFDYLRGEVIWLNCHEDDRLHAVMLAIKKLNSTISFRGMAFSNNNNGVEEDDEQIVIAPKVQLRAEVGEDHLPL